MAYRIEKKQSELLTAVPMAASDPWAAANHSFGDNKEGWMLSYIDVLTLLLTLLVLLLAYQRIEHEEVVSSSFPINRENKVAEKERGLGLAEQQLISSDSDHAEQRDKPFLLIGGSSVNGESKVAEKEPGMGRVEKQTSSDLDRPEHPDKSFVFLEEPVVVAVAEQVSSLIDKVIDTATSVANLDNAQQKKSTTIDAGDQANSAVDSDAQEPSLKDLAMEAVAEVTESTKDLPIVDIAALETFVKKVAKVISPEKDGPSNAEKTESPTQENGKEGIAIAGFENNTGVHDVSTRADSKRQETSEKAMKKVASNESTESKQNKPVGDSESKLSPVEGQRLFRGTSDVLKANVLITELANSDNELVEIVQEGRSIRIEVNDGVLFGSSRGDLKAGAGALLDNWIDLLKQQKGTIFVEGHTDSRPIATRRFPSNWELSSARAGAVTRYFLERGIDPSRLRAVGYADTRPRGDNNTAEGRKKNRRVSIVIQP